MQARSVLSPGKKKKKKKKKNDLLFFAKQIFLVIYIFFFSPSLSQLHYITRKRGNRN